MTHHKRGRIRAWGLIGQASRGIGVASVLFYTPFGTISSGGLVINDKPFFGENPENTLLDVIGQPE